MNRHDEMDVQTYWEENGKIFSLKYPLIWEILQTVSTDSIELVKCHNGDYTLKLGGVDRKYVVLNSKYQLAKDNELAKNKVNYSDNAIVWIGFGMGHEIKEIIKHKHSLTTVVIIEPRLDILKMALMHTDMRALLQQEGVYFLCGSMNILTEQIDIVAKQLVVSVDQIGTYEHPASERLYLRDEVINILVELRRHLLHQSAYIGNMTEDTLLGINHFFSNMKYILQSPNLSDIGNVYKNFPVICVAAGPSLDKNINVLKQIQDKTIIFAVDTVWVKLLKEGIIPDAIITFERDKLIYRMFFEGKHAEIVQNRICLFAQTVVYPKVLSEFNGKYVITSRSAIPFDYQAADAIKTLNSCSIGVNCAHMSFGIARRLGCNPIVLIGQDLAFGENGFSHAIDTYGEKKTKKDAIFKGMENMVVPNIDQTGFVETNQVYDLFRHWFEQEVKQDPSFAYINATEGGAYIAGMDVMTLREVDEKYLQHGKPKNRLYEVLDRLVKPHHVEVIQFEANQHFSKQLGECREISAGIDQLKQLAVKMDKLHLTVGSDQSVIDQVQQLLQRGLMQMNPLLSQLSPTLLGILQYEILKYQRFTNTHSHVKTVDQLINFQNFFQNYLTDLDKVMNLLIAEYERGIEIIENDGVCENIDTPLLGEMYE